MLFCVHAHKAQRHNAERLSKMHYMRDGLGDYFYTPTHHSCNVACRSKRHTKHNEQTHDTIHYGRACTIIRNMWTRCSASIHHTSCIHLYISVSTNMYCDFHIIRYGSGFHTRTRSQSQTSSLEEFPYNRRRFPAKQPTDPHSFYQLIKSIIH